MCFTNYSTIQIQLQIRLWTWIHIIIKQWDRIRHIVKNVFVKTREIKSERLFTLESNFFNCSSYEIVVLYSKIEQFFILFLFQAYWFMKMKPTALLDQIIILLESSVWNISAIKVQNQSILTLFSTRTCNWARCSVFSRVCSSKQDGEHYEGDSSGLCWPLYGLPPGHRTKKRDQQVYESTSVGTFIPR